MSSGSGGFRYIVLALLGVGVGVSIGSMNLLRGDTEPRQAAAQPECAPSTSPQDDVSDARPPRRSPRLATHQARADENVQTVARDYWQEHIAEIRDHERATKDGEWAQATEATIQKSAAELATSATLGRPDCRTTTCTIPFEWPDRATAIRQYADAVHHDYGVPCGTRILLPPEEDSGNGATTAVLFLRCERTTKGVSR